ncbi:Protein of unknown function [Bacillus cytotoxicus]|nr:Protein of unknown function [Bacillus cytotoxicus]
MVYTLKGLFDALKESLNQHVPADWKKIDYIQSDRLIPIVRKRRLLTKWKNS